MKFAMIHENLNVSDLERSIRFYREALGLEQSRRVEAEGFTIAYLRDGVSGFELELTALRGHPQKYDLGEGEFHLAFRTDDFKAAHELHKAMGCVCFENEAMGIYFIEDPDGYWLEILPTK